MSAQGDRYQERPGRHRAVAAVWSYAAGDASSSLIAADGCFDLIVRADQRGRARASVYTPVTSAHLAEVDAATRVIGLRFRPGHGAALMDGGTAILHAVDRHLRENGIDPDRLELLVGEAVDASKPPSIVTEFVLHARETSGCLRLTSQFSRCERTLQRTCRRWLGLTPKAFLRIERAWVARSAIRDGRPLAAIAVDLGYSDQAHMTRDVRALLGVTPRQLRPVGILQDLGTANR